jgi:ATP-binding cassette, subfamily A (ABC1), member 3
MKKKKLEPMEVRKDQLDQFCEIYGIRPEDRAAISESGAGSYIYFALESRGAIEVYNLVEYFELCNLLRTVIAELQTYSKEVEELERLQTFIRLKIKGKPRIGGLFDFFETNKKRLRIQQYTIKQASVEQIFNKFAEAAEEAEFS